MPDPITASRPLPPDVLAAAVRTVATSKTVSPNSLQRRVRVGFATAARLVDLLEEEGVIACTATRGTWEPLIGPADVQATLDRLSGGTSHRSPVAAVTGPRGVQVEGDLFHGRVPAGAIYVGRAAPGLPASKFGNPFRLRLCVDRAHPLRGYVEAAVGEVTVITRDRLDESHYDLIAVAIPSVAAAAYRRCGWPTGPSWWPPRTPSWPGGILRAGAN